MVEPWIFNVFHDQSIAYVLETEGDSSGFSRHRFMGRAGIFGFIAASQGMGGERQPLSQIFP
jgi:hypothetical protein